MDDLAMGSMLTWGQWAFIVGLCLLCFGVGVWLEAWRAKKGKR